jgi:DNA-binding transcriptional LysR family regulator
MELYPDIDVILLLDDSELDLSMREADVAIRLRRPTQPDLIQRKLFTVRHHVYASADYVRRRGMPKSVDDLDNHIILTFGQAPQYLTTINWLETVGRPDDQPRRAALRINNAYALRRAVETGIGIASIPDYIINRDAGLVQVDLGTDMPSFDTYFVYPEELKDTKRVTVFRDFLVSKAKEWEF